MSLDLKESATASFRDAHSGSWVLSSLSQGLSAFPFVELGP